ncbi:MAG TPA: penicillin-binding transpeptidase domain-containing protein [Thermoanaerobaculia bacterium]|nr:penicillin-binding transpeptidase domain-containing protein [Thermoanaerobaculia bacterium]
MKRLLAPLFVALAVLVALLFGVAWLPLREARDAWRAGRDAGAVATAERWSRLRLWPSSYDQLLAAAYLTVGNRAAAQGHLHGQPLRPVIAEDEVARRLFARERYDDFLAYDAAFHDDGAALYRTAALAATHRTAEAAAALRGVRGADPKKVALLQNVIAGNAVWFADRNGAGIDNADFAPLVRALPHGSSIVETTLDPLVQRAALQALGGYRGAIVAIDPRTNEVLAIASSAKENLAIDGQYEPGSVIKVLTGLNALTNGVDVRSMFPYVCKGELMIDGRHFGDWVPSGHGTLNSIDDALAVSCNVFFADVGLRLGRDRLQQFMKSAGFDGQTNTGVMTVPLGKLLERPDNNFETAFLAIGLKHESINAFHLAVLASAMANRGVLTAPRLLRARRSILGDVVALPPAQGHVQLGSPAAAETMIHAMQAVVTEPRGTGRRAPVPGLTMAMKTGTAGERKAGLEALIMAFAPAEQPRIAFGIIAENAGPAELAGAKIAHDFLAAVQTRLH